MKFLLPPTVHQTQFFLGITRTPLHYRYMFSGCMLVFIFMLVLLGFFMEPPFLVGMMGVLCSACGFLSGALLFAPTASHIKNSSVSKIEPCIDGRTYSLLKIAIREFSMQYPDHTKKKPKLDDDIRPWLKSAGYAKNDREAFVFGTIISEHFDL